MRGTTTETFAYDALGWLSSHASDLGSFTLAYLGQTGQITSRALGGTSLATTWTYRSNTNDRRLASVGTTGLSAGQSTSFAYASNAGGFTTGVTQTSDAARNYPPTPLLQSASYNNLNQLTNLSGQALTYDADGNLTSDGTRTYAWDAENRLVGIGYPSQPGKATAFAYDGLGRRISISSTPASGGAPTVTNYVWCDTQLCQAQTSAGANAREYEPEGELLPGTAALYYAPDQLGSVRRVYSSSSAPASDYDPYGVALQAAAPTTDFAYASTFYNADSGLYLTTFRPYDPTTGRFLSSDLIGEAGDPIGNLYVYVGGDPTGAIDPLGLFCPPSWWPKLSGPSLFALGGEFAGTGGIGGVGGAGVYVDQNGDIGIYTSHGFAAGGPGVSLAAAATESQSRASFFGQSAGVTVSGGEAVVGSVSVTGNPAGLTSSVAVGVGGGEPVNVQVVGPNTQPLVEFNSPVVAVAVKGLMILNGATFR